MLLGGSSGFIGRALATSLTGDGHAVIPLTRGSGQGVQWDPERGTIDAARLAAASPDIVVNLAGAPIAHRWTAARLKSIYDSRINGTRALAEAVARLPRKPRAFIGGSAVGYYGSDRGDERLTEASGPGADFLATTTRDWEASTVAARDSGLRVVALRTGIVCGREGGALAKMLPPFLAGVGGPLGDGRQWMSWISLTDTVRAIRFLIDAGDAAGAYNVVAPEPVRNEDFAATLGQVLHRPALVRTPGFALRMLFGDMATHTILASQRVVPERFAGAGFEFRHPRLEMALRSELRRSDDPAAR